MELQTNENETNEHVAQNFETLNHDPSESSGDILLDNSCDPDLHFFNNNIQNLNTILLDLDEILLNVPLTF